MQSRDSRRAALPRALAGLIVLLALAAEPTATRAREVTEEEVSRALERALIQQGAFVLPPAIAEIEPGLAYVRNEADIPVLVIAGKQRSLTTGKFRSNRVEGRLTLRVGLPLQSQVEVELPYAYQDDSTVVRLLPSGLSRKLQHDAVGFGDVALTVTRLFLRERGWRPDLLARLRWDSDTGESHDGIQLGTGFHEIGGALTAVKTQDPLAFVGEVSYTTSFASGGIDPGDSAGFSLGTILAASPDTSLRLFLNQRFVRETEVNGKNVPGSDQVLATLSVGASSLISARVLVDVVVGIGLTDDTPDYFVNVRVPVRFALFGR